MSLRITIRPLFSRGAALALLALLTTSATSVHAITIDTVPVGNAGNAGDLSTTNPTGNLAGDVSYAYRIGTYEVTVGQYTEFLNAVAATDTYSLYNTNMATDLNIAGISQSGVSGSYSYSVIGSANHPINYVSWGDAARFSNWMYNSQPTGAQGAGTTERGSYTLDGAITNAALMAVSRSTGATWVIPTNDEWHKAAYHKNDGVTGNYWDYPTSTDAVPYSDQPPGSGAPTPSNTANFYKDDGVANGYNDGLAVTGMPLSSYDFNQNYLTDVGAYSSSTSPYGTFDQGGNVMEWIEDVSGSFDRLFRGSSSRGAPLYMQSVETGFQSDPTHEDNDIGFRVATVAVPEPNSLILGGIGLVGLLVAVRRRAAISSQRSP